MDALAVPPPTFDTFLTSNLEPPEFLTRLSLVVTNFGCVLLIADSELEELHFQLPRRHRTEELAKLAKTTKFTRKEIQLIYRGFKQVSLALVDRFATFAPESVSVLCDGNEEITPQQRVLSASACCY
jgi:hypothetical protein